MTKDELIKALVEQVEELVTQVNDLTSRVVTLEAESNWNKSLKNLHIKKDEATPRPDPFPNKYPNTPWPNYPIWQQPHYPTPVPGAPTIPNGPYWRDGIWCGGVAQCGDQKVVQINNSGKE